eukprot:9503911-Pyramimonas_sp.AAC.1
MGSAKAAAGNAAADRDHVKNVGLKLQGGQRGEVTLAGLLHDLRGAESTVGWWRGGGAQDPRRGAIAHRHPALA